MPVRMLSPEGGEYWRTVGPVGGWTPSSMPARLTATRNGPKRIISVSGGLRLL